MGMQSIRTVSLFLVVAACGTEEHVATEAAELLVVDGNNNGGVVGFYFHAPYGVPPVPYPGTFDGGFDNATSGLGLEFAHLSGCLPDSTIDGITSSYTHTGIAVYPTATDPFYGVSRNTNTVPVLLASHCYRMQVKLGGAILGYNDLHLTSGTAASGYRKIPPGSNIQVRWRLETSLRLDSDEDTIPNWRDNCVSVANQNQLDSNMNGIGDACEIFDEDGDTVADSSDNCPTVPNLDQANSDSDPLGDACETCDTDPAKSEPGLCGCGTADTDTDLDGTPDCHDECSTDPNKIEFGICGCGVPETDTDQDTRPDCIETCL